jgi:hypothetical protein
LRRQRLPDDLAYACFVRAENLLATRGGQELETIQAARSEMEAHLGKRIGDMHKNLPGLLANAASLPTSSFR